jgi:hypothetical protein
MTTKEVERKITTTNKVKLYIAFDGTEFLSEDSCKNYETAEREAIWSRIKSVFHKLEDEHATKLLDEVLFDSHELEFYTFNAKTSDQLRDIVAYAELNQYYRWYKDSKVINYTIDPSELEVNKTYIYGVSSSCEGYFFTSADKFISAAIDIFNEVSEVSIDKIEIPNTVILGNSMKLNNADINSVSAVPVLVDRKCLSEDSKGKLIINGSELTESNKVQEIKTLTYNLINCSHIYVMSKNKVINRINKIEDLSYGKIDECGYVAMSWGESIYIAIYDTVPKARADYNKLVKYVE